MKKIKIDKELLYKKFIKDNKTAEKIAKELNISRKTILRRLKEYGISKIKKGNFDNKDWLYREYIIKNRRIIDIAKEENVTEKVIKNRIKQFEFKKEIEKQNKLREETMLEKYGKRNALQLYEVRKKAKKSIKEKYGADNFLKSEYFKKNLKLYKQKEYETKRKNNSFNSSKIEDKIYTILNEYFNNVERNKIIDKYNCDFYLPEYNLYIEFNGHWTHGKEIFNFKNKNHIILLEKWKLKNTKFYNNAIYVWTKKDPEKRQFMINNKIKFLEIWNYISEDDLLKQIKRML